MVKMLRFSFYITVGREAVFTTRRNIIVSDSRAFLDFVLDGQTFDTFSACVRDTLMRIANPIAPS